MGTDDRGRDVLSRLLYGYRVSMTYALGVWLITYFLGTVAGGFMGYKGGVFDFLSQRFIEVLSSLPYLSVLIILIDIFEPNITLLIVITSIFGWIGISYYMRAEFLKLRNFEFVEAGRALGMSTSRILFKHILPNALGPLITFSPFAIAGGVTALVGLDYLGFGVQPPTPSWGELLNQGKELYSIAWWLALYPSLFLFGTLTFFNLIGEGFRYAFDPKKG
jgi:microcin C transport system permease protein